MSDESREKMRQAWARRRALGLPGSRLGVRHTDETREKIRAATVERTSRGPNHYAWQGGITESRRRGRKIPGYKAWRREVCERAGGYCEACQCDRGKGHMTAHHIVGYAARPDLATDPNNGTWLCDGCHRECHAR